jgi:uncharacterized protein YjbI with pentapeptide repeats
MIRQKNLTPFAFGYRLTSRRPPERELVAVVRGKFRLAPGELFPAKAELTRLDLSDPRMPEAARAAIERASEVVGQGSLTADRYDDDDPQMRGALDYASDLADWKARGEWLVKAHGHAPSGIPTTSCDVRVEVGASQKTLRVTGPRAWVDRFAGGAASEPVAFRALPIDWAHSYGGPDFPDNPVGKGHLLSRPPEEHGELDELPGAIRSAFLRRDELPNVEYPSSLVKRQGDVPRPASFGPVNPWWPTRKALLGKEYGDEYQARYAPFYPCDFDWSYFQAAPRDQQIDGYFRGDEPVLFVNLHPAVSEFRTRLPGIRVRVFVERSGVGLEVPLVLDTVFADLDRGELSLTWRGLLPVQEDDYSDVPFALVVSEDLATAPRPASEYLALLAKFAADPAGLGDTDLAKPEALKSDIDSGRLAQDIDALPEGPGLFGAIAERIGRGLMPEAELGAMRSGLVPASEAALASNPRAAGEVKRAVISALERGRDIPGPPLGSDAEGRPTAAPALRLLMGELARVRATTPEVEWDDVDEVLEDAFARSADAGIAANSASFSTAARLGAADAAPGPHADLSGQDLSDRDLRGLDLTGVNLTGATLSRARLDGARLVGAKLVGAGLSRACLDGAQCERADFTRAILSRTSLVGAKLDGAHLERALLIDADLGAAILTNVVGDAAQAQRTRFHGAHIDGASFEFSVFDGSDFTEATLSVVNVKRTLFRECKLGRARLIGADASRAGFLSCDLAEARLTRLRGVGTNFLRSTLVRADLSFASLKEALFITVNASGANLFAGELPKARFFRANLRGANLERANLLRADLRKAVLTEASLRYANLYDARLVEAVGTDLDLGHANLKKAVLDRARLVTR